MWRFMVYKNPNELCVFDRDDAGARIALRHSLKKRNYPYISLLLIDEKWTPQVSHRSTVVNRMLRDKAKVIICTYDEFLEFYKTWSPLPDPGPEVTLD